VALLLPVQSSRESPKSGGVPLSPFAHGTLALPAKSPFSHYPLLGLQTLSISVLRLQTLSSPRRHYANSPRIWYAACHLLLLLLIFVGSYPTPHIPPYFGKHLKLVPTLRRFLAYHILRVLVMLPAALPRCSPDAPSTLLTPLSFYSAGHPPRSNLKSPAPIFPMFPLGHRYS